MADAGRWVEGAATVTEMIAARELEKVAPSPTHAKRLLDEAERHLVSAQTLADLDPPIAYDSLYTAARKALAAVLAKQGLHGHIARWPRGRAARHRGSIGRMRQVVRAFNRLRITRNEAEYPSEEYPPLSPADAREDLPEAVDIVEAMKKFVSQVGSF